MEFHRKYGERGLRYHKVTDNKAPLSDKHPYYPDDIKAKVFEVLLVRETNGVPTSAARIVGW